jgi:hypothetical protein
MSFSSEQTKALTEINELKRLRNAAAKEVKRKRDEARKAGDLGAEIAAKRILVQLSRVNLFITSSRRSIMASANLTVLNNKLKVATQRGRKAQSNLKAISTTLNKLAGMVRVLAKLGNIFT